MEYLKSFASHTVEKCPHPSFWISTYRFMSTYPMWQGWYLHKRSYTLQLCNPKSLHLSCGHHRWVWQWGRWECWIQQQILKIILIDFFRLRIGITTEIGISTDWWSRGVRRFFVLVVRFVISFILFWFLIFWLGDKLLLRASGGIFNFVFSAMI